jgi:hypothetical protein
MILWGQARQFGGRGDCDAATIHCLNEFGCSGITHKLCASECAIAGLRSKALEVNSHRVPGAGTMWAIAHVVVVQHRICERWDRARSTKSSRKSHAAALTRSDNAWGGPKILAGLGGATAPARIQIPYARAYVFA